MNSPIQKQALAMKSRLITWRRRFHMHPELSFKEKETQLFIADTLRKLPGMKVEMAVGCPTSVIGTLENGEGPAAVIRADMDALPIQEENEADYRSQKNGIMHACGHDAHMAIGLGTAHILAELFQSGQIHGKVKFIFQPAEESADEKGSTGAPYLVEAGVLDGADLALALHMSPENPIGEVQIHDGYSMANVDVFTAHVYGSGGHGAYPHLGTDPVWMLGTVMQAMSGIISRRISPLEAAVISIGSIHGGFASNVIPSEVKVSGTIRSYKPEIRERLHTELRQVFSLVETLGGEYSLTITAEDPALNNHPHINQLIRKTIAAIYPDFKMLNTPFGLGGEDFAHMTKAVPGAMFFLGCAKKEGIKRELHTPRFDIDENVLPVGVSILAETTVRFLDDKAAFWKGGG